MNVLEASKERISYIFDNFERIYVSFSGGKDSTVMLNIAMDEAIERNRKIGLLFIDWEVQYKYTIDFVESMFEKYKEYIVPYWIALPLSTESAISTYAPEWVCWDKTKKDLWVRNSPDYAITDYSYFDFYEYGMTFETFVIEFHKWYAKKGFENEVYEPTACMVGIRASESLNRRMKITVNKNRDHYNGKNYLLNLRQSEMDIVSCHPIYDWKVEDIWTYYAKYKTPYNKIYDLMHQAGVPISKQRIDEFFGSEARKGLWMLHEIEPQTWSKVCGRIVGCNSGALYAKNHGNINGDRYITKPENHTWESYARFLLDTMPSKIATHYKNKIAVYLKWYKDRGYKENIPDFQENDLGVKDKASWRRICKVLLKNDYWCKALCFSPNKPTHYERYLEMMKTRREKWGMLI